LISDLVTRKCSPRLSTLEEDMGDVLGGVFSELDLGNKWAGQFFTPDPVCRMMAAMTFDSSAREIIETRWLPWALARSTRDLLNVLATISDKGAGFKSLADAWADTTTAHGRLMLTVLGGLAEFERELIRARTDEGRKRAQARGVRFGRKLKLTQHQIAEALQRREAGEALVEIGRSYNVSHSTISRL